MQNFRKTGQNRAVQILFVLVVGFVILLASGLLLEVLGLA